jgi:hypothetical protein
MSNTNSGNAERNINQNSFNNNSFVAEINSISQKVEGIFNEISSYSGRIDILRNQINVFESNFNQKITNIETEIKKLAEKINSPEEDKQEEKTCWIKKIPAWVCILVASIGGAIIFILIMILFQEWWGFEVPYENSTTTIVLGFVGIAATFIVVSNYAQVKEVKNSFVENVDEALNKYEQMIKGEVEKQIISYKLVLEEDVKKYMNIQRSSGQYHLLFIESIIDSLSPSYVIKPRPSDEELNRIKKNRNEFVLDRLKIAYIFLDGLTYSTDHIIDTTNVVAKINVLIESYREEKTVHDSLCDLEMLLNSLMVHRAIK